jgi:hypothetical protein
MTRQFEARATSYKSDCVLCRQGRAIWRHRAHRRFYICDDCFAADRHLGVDPAQHPRQIDGGGGGIGGTGSIRLS